MFSASMCYEEEIFSINQFFKKWPKLHSHCKDYKLDDASRQCRDIYVVRV